ncbi:MAG: inositol monophosphatase [Deltaproteobacteria bacterium]|nr:MAG: inositol monophosphatase [Deltaproteobacteria bacterium]
MTTLDVALEAARAAGRILAEAHHSRRFDLAKKGDVNLVTSVDHACERAVRQVLARHTPSIPVLGEESGGAEQVATRWVVDPLDGTTNFVHGFPWFAVSIALEIEGRPQVGVVLDPLRDQAFTAVRGEGAWLGTRRLRVSDTASLDQALLATGFPYDRRENLDLYLSRVRAALLHTRGIRRAGAASLDLARVAAGQLDAYWEYNLEPWDVAAGRLLVEEAGGRVTDPTGQDLDRSKPSPLASNGRLHAAMVEMLAEPD